MQARTFSFQQKAITPLKRPNQEFKNTSSHRPGQPDTCIKQKAERSAGRYSGTPYSRSFDIYETSETSEKSEDRTTNLEQLLQSSRSQSRHSKSVPLLNIQQENQQTFSHKPFVKPQLPCEADSLEDSLDNNYEGERSSEECESLQQNLYDSDSPNTNMNQFRPKTN